MHVIIVYDFGNVNGGAAQVAIAEALELAKRGLRVTYFCAVGPVDNRLASAGVEVLCLGQQDILADSDRLSAVRRGIWNTAAAKALRSLLSQAGCDRSVVHIHGWTKALSASVLSVVRDAKVPYVVTAHDYFSVCPNGGYYNYKAQSVCRLVPMSLGCMASDCDARGYHHKLFRVARQAVAVATSDIQGQLPHVIYISDFSRSVLLPSFGTKTTWYYLPNPVNAERSNRIQASLNRHFLYVGRISAEKGVELFCRAATVAGVPARVVGDGPLGKTLRDKWSAVEFLGWMAPAQVKAMMSEARALVFPSEWYETFGLVVAEALSMGIPVVASRQTGAAELIIDGENGRLIDSGDCDGLVRAMSSLAEDAIVEQMSISAFSRFWRDPSTLASHCAELERVYTAVIENGDR